MSLRNIEYKEDYRSGYDDVVGDLLQPSLLEARDYWRAVGYFSSSALEAFGAPLGEFVRQGGSIRLVTSVELSQADVEAIERGVNKREVTPHGSKLSLSNTLPKGLATGSRVWACSCKWAA